VQSAVGRSPGRHQGARASRSFNLPRISSPDPRPASSSAASLAQLKACERQLRRSGLPTLIEDYSATEDIFTRALPFLVFVAVLEVVGAVNLDWSWWQNLAALVGGAALLMTLFALFNTLRGRPFTALPRSVGVPELTAFVILPAFLPAVFGGQLGAAAGTVLGNLVLVGLVYLVIGVGLFSIVRWAGARLFAQLAASLTLLVRALPLILFFGLLSFFTAEMWQLFSAVPTGRYVAAVVLFFLVGLVFLSVRLPDSVRSIEDGVDDLNEDKLSKVQRLNLSIVVLASQSLQILLVAVLVWLFFTVAGSLLVDLSVVESWTAGDAETLFHFGVLGERVTVTAELLRTATGIALFAGLYYTVAMLVDATYRDEFVAELTDQMRSTFSTRTEYLRLRDAERGERPVDSGGAGSSGASDPAG
jgi:hypothetical protein